MDMILTCDACGRVGNEDDGIEPGGPCQEPCDGIVRRHDWDVIRTHRKVPDELVCEQQVAHPDDVEIMLNADVDTGDGRSEWAWFRLPEGTLIFGCFPQGDTYFETEIRRSV